MISKKRIVQEKKVQQMINERHILSALSHPFIVSLHAAFASKNYLLLVLDLCPGGELFYHLSKYRKFNENVAKFYLVEVILAVQYLHEKNILYRDLKPENIVIDEQGHLKITDFGLSQLNFKWNSVSTEFCGSPEYMAPEMIMQMGHGREIDYYALGVLMYEMLVGIPPHYNSNRAQMYSDILHKKENYPFSMSHLAVSFIKALLQKDPKQRLGSRGGIVEIKQHPFLADVDWNAMLNKKIPPPLAITKSASNFDQKYTKMKLQFDEDEEESDEEKPEPKSGGKMRNKRAFSFSDVEQELSKSAHLKGRLHNSGGATTQNKESRL